MRVHSLLKDLTKNKSRIAFDATQSIFCGYKFNIPFI